jgi:soluble lytic murein transglycosylase-like protein
MELSILGARSVLSYSAKSGLLLALSLMSLSLMSAMSPAFATAAEEPGLKVADPLAKSAMVEPERIAIGETAVSPSMASDATDAMQQQIGLVAGYVQNYNKRLGSDEIGAISRAIVQYSGRYGVDYRLLTSLIAVESSFRHDVVSSSGAIGMGQLKPDTAKWLGVLDPYDPVDNIAGTARFLSWLVRRYNGKLENALAAYYQGPGYVDRNGITPVCTPYLSKINRALGGLL